MQRVVLLLAATLLGTSALSELVSYQPAPVATEVLYYLPGCPTQRILTSGGSASTFPPLVSSAAATSSFSIYPIEELFEFSYPDTFDSWCASSTGDLPSINITLAAPMVLYGLLSGGYYNLRYVSNFTLEYSESEGGNLSQRDPLGNLLVGVGLLERLQHCMCG